MTPDSSWPKSAHRQKQQTNDPEITPVRDFFVQPNIEFDGSNILP